MLHPALLQLLKLQFRGFFRATRRRMRGWKGMTFAAIGLLIFGTWLLPAVTAGAVMPRSDPLRVRMIVPWMILFVTLFSTLSGAGDKAVAFSAAEVNFLFPGPFTRRQILTFKLAKTALGAIFAALFVSTALMAHSSNIIAGFVAVLLALLFVQWFSTAMVLFTQTVGQHASARWRMVVVLGLLAAIVVAVVPAVRRGITEAGFAGVATALDQSLVAKIITAPFVPIARVMTARSMVGELLPWAAVALLLDALLLAAIFRLDADYNEAALAASQRHYQRLERMKKGNVLAVDSTAVAGVKRLRLPAPTRRLGGAAPFAWRQAVTALRTSRTMLLFVGLAAAGLAPILAAAPQKVVLALMIQGAAWMTIFFAALLRFDFRGDLEQLEWLKALPVSPHRVAAGQLVTPVAILTMFQAILLTSSAFVLREHRGVLLLTIAFLPPFNLLLFGIENTMFLLYPVRAAQATPGDVSQLGRQVVMFILKMLVSMVAVAFAGALGFAAYLTFGRSMAAGLIVAWLVLATVAVSSVPLVGLAYRSFDPSVDTPP